MKLHNSLYKMFTDQSLSFLQFEKFLSAVLSALQFIVCLLTAKKAVFSGS